MKYCVKDSFNIPHTKGVVAKVVRLDYVLVTPNLFGGYGARIFAEGAATSQDVVDVRVGVADPWIQKKIGTNVHQDADPADEDVLLWCERCGENINWYKVTYECSN